MCVLCAVRCPKAFSSSLMLCTESAFSDFIDMNAYNVCAVHIKVCRWRSSGSLMEFCTGIVWILTITIRYGVRCSTKKNESVRGSCCFCFTEYIALNNRRFSKQHAFLLKLHFQTTLSDHFTLPSMPRFVVENLKVLVCTHKFLLKNSLLFSVRRTLSSVMGSNGSNQMNNVQIFLWIFFLHLIYTLWKGIHLMRWWKWLEKNLPLLFYFVQKSILLNLATLFVMEIFCLRFWGLFIYLYIHIVFKHIWCHFHHIVILLFLPLMLCERHKCIVSKELYVRFVSICYTKSNNKTRKK